MADNNAKIPNSQGHNVQTPEQRPGAQSVREQGMPVKNVVSGPTQFGASERTLVGNRGPVKPM